MNVPLDQWRPVARGQGVTERTSVKADDRPDPLPRHVGVWLDRMLHEPGRGEEKPGRQALYTAAIQALGPRASATLAYKSFFERWERSLGGEPGVRTRKLRLEATSRTLLHPASNQSVTDGGVLLHHTYSVPYLPGSALKGLLRRAVERAGGAEGYPLAAALFGPDREVPGQKDAPDARGWLDVLDALWIPGSGAPGTGSPLALDIVNPHHPHWYTRSGERRSPAMDYDSPVPTHRLSLAPGARFLFALEWCGQDGADPLAPVVESLIRLLTDALANDGIGAWTSVGYGRFSAETYASQGGVVGGTSPAPRATEAAPWIAARLVRNPGNRELTATLTDGRRALATGTDADRLFATLPAEIQQRLKDRKTVALEVEVAPVGLQLRLVGLRVGA